MTRKTGVAFVVLLFSFGSIFAVEVTNDFCPCTSNAIDYRLPSVVIPRHYYIGLRQQHDRSFYGECKITIEITRATTNIILHARELYIFPDTIRLSNVNKSKVNNEDMSLKPQALHYSEQIQICAFDFYETLYPGNYTLSMVYTTSTQYTEYKYESNNDPRLVGKWPYITDFELIGARSMFPCWDEPTFKAIFKISIEHAYKFHVHSCMPIMDEIMLHQSQITIFEPTPVMSTYLVTFAIGTPQNYMSHDDIKLYMNLTALVYVYPITSIALDAQSFLKNYTNNLWESNSNLIIVDSNLKSKAVGAWRFTVFRDIYYRLNFHFHGRRLEIHKIISSQLTKQCIESLVSPKEWPQLWLSNAFATLLGYKITAMMSLDEDTMMELFVVQVLQPALHNDVELRVPPVIHEYDPFYASLIYKKASAMMRMFEYIVTKKVLQEALAEYLKRYAYSSATTYDFLSILKNKIRSDCTYRYNAAEMMQTWLSERGYPVLTVRQYKDGTISINVSNSLEKSSHSRNEWQIPTTFTTKEHLNFTQNSPTFWLNSSEVLSVNLSGFYDQSQWVISNIQQFGFYRVRYIDDNWWQILEYLAKNHTKIHVLNRAQLIDDAYHTIMDSRLNNWILNGLVRYLGKETSFIVWHSMMNVLQYMSSFFNLPGRPVEFFKELVLKSMNETLTTLGFHEKSEFIQIEVTELLLLNWVCKHGHVECRKWAYNKLMMHIDDSEKKKPILPEWEAWMFCAGVMNGRTERWISKVMHHIMQKDKQMLKHMACVDDDRMLSFLLKLITTKPLLIEWKELETEQIQTLYYSIVKRHARKDQVLDLVLEILDEIPNG
ncbi:PREDICTED: aminopeptidase N-like [Dinoponera quadriceps]|uniref:Aminopeptidase N-like n=1 Tax=Dinoponera quadriceps TaxID=609295 RepID=A0A6P3Y2L6_DINQU|nr:PREDICTED: aminopeptidase N-like [Dinoponera quadriceps]